MRISDWSSDVCSSDLQRVHMPHRGHVVTHVGSQKHQAEVGQVDLAQQAPGQAQPQTDQAVEAADEDPREDGLGEQVETRETHLRLAGSVDLQLDAGGRELRGDRKSTRLTSSQYCPSRMPF